jgi:ribulose-5-phosphate 4-epimerase/fuculose-1-phosphate aldolase
MPGTDHLWEVCWYNLYNISLYHPNQKKFVTDVVNMDRFNKDVQDTRKEGTEHANELMTKFLDLVSNHGIYNISEK